MDPNTKTDAERDAEARRLQIEGQIEEQQQESVLFPWLDDDSMADPCEE